METIKKIIKKVLKKHRNPLLFLFCTWGIFFLIIWLNAFKVSPESIKAGPDYLWGDWALHLGIASVFEFRSPQNWFSQHPVYLGTPLNYPFAADAISGLLTKMGMSLELSFVLPSILFTFLLITGMYFFFYQLVKSKKLAVLGVFLFMFSAGFGFLDFIPEFFEQLKSSSFSEAIGSTILEHEFYSRIDKFEWYSSNTITAFLLPQRAFLMGMGISLWIINSILWLCKHLFTNKILVISGVVLGTISGLLMITHIHSLIALIFVCAGLFILSLLLKKKRLLKHFWLPYIASAGVISSLLYLQFIRGSIDTSSFFRISPFWTFDNLLWWMRMWFFVWGPPWILAIYGGFKLIKKYMKKKVGSDSHLQLLTAVCLGLTGLFLISNLVIFQPFAFDNTKLFFWSFLALIALSLVGLQDVIKLRKKYPHYSVLITGVIVIFIVASCFTGFLDLTKMTDQVLFNKHYLMNENDSEVAEFFMQNATEGSVCLTSQKPNHPVFMRTHCQVLAAYEGWIYSYGIDYHQRLSDIRNMYANPEENLDLFEKYKVDYVVIEKNGFESYSGYVNAHYFETNSDKFSLIFQNESYRIFSTNF